MPRTVGVLFAAGSAGWSTVVGVTLVVWLGQIGLSAGFSNLGYLLPLSLLAAVASYFIAIPVCMGSGLIASAVTRWLGLRSRWQWAVVGLVVGLIIAGALAILPTQIAPMITAPVAALFAVAGAVAGDVAWREHKKSYAA